MFTSYNLNFMFNPSDGVISPPGKIKSPPSSLKGGADAQAALATA